MRNKKTYYKLVKDDFSSGGLCLDNCYSTRYPIAQWHTPPRKGTKLFVFESFETAMHFNCGVLYGTAQVFECEVKNPSKPKRIAEPYAVDIALFWENKRKHKKQLVHHTKLPPAGTVWCDAVRLTKHIT